MPTPQKPLFILGHLGLGDHIICNGLVRVLVERHGGIIIPCYPHNLQAVTFMFRDDPRIEVVEAQNSTHAAGMAVAHENFLPLGDYRGGKWDRRRFDQEFYSQANVDFNHRWNSFRVDHDFKYEIENNFVLMHDDKERGFVIDHNKIHITARPPQYFCKQYPFFDHLEKIVKAEEIHVINSSFLCLIDSLANVEGQYLILHEYARPNGERPTLKRDWKILS